MSLYFKANDIAEDKQVPILLSSIGAQTNSLLQYLVAPNSPGDLSFAQLSEVVATSCPIDIKHASQPRDIFEGLHSPYSRERYYERYFNYVVSYMHLLCTCHAFGLVL